MEILDFSVAPGGVRELHCQGSYVYFYAGSAGGADATIGVKMDARGERVLLMPGQAFRMEPGQQAQRWIISNHAGQATISGRLVIGSGQIDDNRVTGSVEVIDGGKNRSRGNGAYTMPNGVTAGAGLYPFHGIYNPAGSGKVVMVNGITMSSTTAQAIYLEYGAGDPGGSVNTPVNKNVGGVSSVAALGRQGSSGAAPGNALVYVNVQANNTFDFKFSEPVVINPGYYVRAIGGTVATELGSTFQFYEESV